MLSRRRSSNTAKSNADIFEHKVAEIKTELEKYRHKITGQKIELISSDPQKRLVRLAVETPEDESPVTFTLNVDTEQLAQYDDLTSQEIAILSRQQKWADRIIEQVNLNRCLGIPISPKQIREYNHQLAAIAQLNVKLILQAYGKKIDAFKLCINDNDTNLTYFITSKQNRRKYHNEETPALVSYQEIASVNQCVNKLQAVIDKESIQLSEANTTTGTLLSALGVKRDDEDNDETVVHESVVQPLLDTYDESQLPNLRKGTEIFIRTSSQGSDGDRLYFTLEDPVTDTAYRFYENQSTRNICYTYFNENNQSVSEAVEIKTDDVKQSLLEYIAEDVQCRRERKCEEERQQQEQETLAQFLQNFDKEHQHIWAIDFDETLTKRHCTSELAREKDPSKIEQNLKNPEQMATFIRRRQAKGDKVVIVTFSFHREAIQRYLQVLLGDDWPTLIPVIISKDKTEVIPQNKNGYIARAFSELSKDDHILEQSMDKFGKKNITLIDDRDTNIIAAKTGDFSALHCDEANLYLAVLDKLSKVNVPCAMPKALTDIEESNAHLVYPSIAGNSLSR